MSEEFKSPILVTGTVTPSGTQDVNIVSPNPLPVSLTPVPVLTSTVTRVSSSSTNQLLVATNNNRKGLIFYNDGIALQYIKFGTSASVTSFTIRLTDHSVYEVQPPLYDGQIDFISSNTDGAIQVTELS